MVLDADGRSCLSCEFYVTAAKLLDSNHPMHKAFLLWCKQKTPTKRQAAKFLRESKENELQRVTQITEN